MVNTMKWDKGLDYQFVYSKLLNKMKRNNKKVVKCYCSILLIQLRNGARISEAVRAFKLWLQTGKNEVMVNVSKKKKIDLRLMVIPTELSDLRGECVFLSDVGDDVLVKRVKAWSARSLKINTHSLRYAFITYLLKQGVNPAIVSKITKHSKLDFILTYTQQKIADEILKSLDS